MLSLWSFYLKNLNPEASGINFHLAGNCTEKKKVSAVRCAIKAEFKALDLSTSGSWCDVWV